MSRNSFSVADKMACHMRCPPSHVVQGLLNYTCSYSCVNLIAEAADSSLNPKRAQMARHQRTRQMKDMQAASYYSAVVPLTDVNQRGEDMSHPAASYEILDPE